MDDLAAAQPFEEPEGVGSIARLYLGNILYALELASLSLEKDGKPTDAGFYRGIARKLAEAHGATKRTQVGSDRNTQGGI